jgi:anthranilate phosphoribosyltransferase
LVVAGVAEDLKQGIVKANESIDSGKANDALMKLCAITNS